MAGPGRLNRRGQSLRIFRRHEDPSSVKTSDMPGRRATITHRPKYIALSPILISEAAMLDFSTGSTRGCGQVICAQ